jgi:predicted MPP superfamily phosphohydrolase
MHRLLTGALKVEQLTIPISGLPASLQGLKLVQLSDFHFDGERLTEKLLGHAIAAANAA